MPNDNFASKHAVILGGGIVGSACALALQARGWRTTLVAPHGMHGTASWGNAGHIAVEQVAPLASLATIRSLPGRLYARGGAVSLPLRDLPAWLPFSLRLLAAARPARFAAGQAALAAALAQAMPAWRRFVTALEQPELLVERGHLVVWESAASAARGRAAWHAADTGTARVHDLTGPELAAIQALVTRRLHGGIRFEGSGQIADPDLLADAIARRYRAAGGTPLAGAARAVECTDGRAAARLDDGTLLEADAVIVAAGAATAPLLAPAGHAVPLIAERGYHIQGEASAWPAHLPPLVFEDRSMIVTRFAGGLRAASFVEFGRLRSAADPSKWRRLAGHAAALGLPLGEDSARWMGARPTLPDYLPAIGRSPRAANLFYAFGHQHLGLTLGPVTGEAIAALVEGTPSPIDLAPFDLSRFVG